LQQKSVAARLSVVNPDSINRSNVRTFRDEQEGVSHENL